MCYCLAKKVLQNCKNHITIVRSFRVLPYNDAFSDDKDISVSYTWEYMEDISQSQTLTKRNRNADTIDDFAITKFAMPRLGKWEISVSVDDGEDIATSETKTVRFLQTYLNSFRSSSHVLRQITRLLMRFSTTALRTKTVQTARNGLRQPGQTTQMVVLLRAELLVSTMLPLNTHTLRIWLVRANGCNGPTANSCSSKIK